MNLFFIFGKQHVLNQNIPPETFPEFLTVAIKLFCSTGLPLARTRRARSTFSSHGPLFSNQGHWLTSTTSIIFPKKNCGSAWNQTRGCWVRSKYAAPVLCCPSPSLCLCWTGIFGKLDQARKVGCCCFGEIYFPLVFPTSNFFSQSWKLNWTNDPYNFLFTAITVFLPDFCHCNLTGEFFGNLIRWL